MDPLQALATLAIYVLVVSTGMLLNRRDRRRETSHRELASAAAAFKVAARTLGLRIVRVRRLRGTRMEGEINGEHVTAQCAARGAHPWLTTITAQSRLALPDDLWIQSHWRIRASLAQDEFDPSAPALDTGDPAFDALVAVRGRPAVARVLLSASVRQALTALARGGAVQLRRGLLVHETLDRIWSADQLVALVRNTRAVLQAFPRVDDLSVALAEAAHSDHPPGVRARCLATLLAEEPDQPRTTAALDNAMADPSDVVRIVAARALGERGVPILREIATRPDNEEEAAAHAIGLLARRLSGSEALAILDSALDAGRRAVALAAIESLGRVGGASACERLQTLVHRDDETMAVAAADALGFIHSATAEEELDRALSAPSPPLRYAAVRALARVGRVPSIVPLRALIEAGTDGPDVITAAHQAITAIQSRTPGASPGQVSLAEGESGDLSLAEGDAGGRLSLSHSPPHR